eukprot:TRINITY_DN4147_c0_g1_i1.p1 TRINITY_DN4147_c0_g1~~TRINITY_DN4147_c0_g1_i1.p1  ORF type:complete len:543 (-),score=132.76 TRINITY_DN4147_c0_g1_i1:66-1694(-)
MGKKTDRMYITSQEWINDFGGKREGYEIKKGGKPLPYYCCSIALTPFQDPVCNSAGIIFDIVNIIPFLKKYGIDPTNGEPLTPKDLIKLTFHKNSNGKYFCPVMYKEFTEFTHIVAIKTSGNVYCGEAIEQLNYKTKSLKDLLTNEPFTKADVITIQDPKEPNRKTVADLYQLRQGLQKIHRSKKTKTSDIQKTPMSDRIFKELEEREKEAEARGDNEKKELPDDLKAVLAQQPAPEKEYRAAYFTASGFTPKPVDEETLRDIGKQTNKKGYLRLVTNMGFLNLEIHCDLVPKACENFLTLCQTGYYKGTIFHRNIKDFMIQGGDPTGTGTGGKSIWGKSFKDEFRPQLTHSERGIVSMANSGPDSNGSQFFITYKAAKHLNNKHTVFGRVVGGMDVLQVLESIPTNGNDVPLETIKILDTMVFSNPFDPVEIEKEKEKERQAAALVDKDADKVGQWYSNPSSFDPTTNKIGVGKYIPDSKKQIKVSQNNNNLIENKTTEPSTTPTERKKRELSLPPSSSSSQSDHRQKKSRTIEANSFENW